MARKADIQYIRQSYVDGTAARKLVFPAAPRKAPAPMAEPEMAQAVQPDQKVRVSVDPLSVIAIVVAAVLLVAMVASLMQYSAARQENVALQEYVYNLRNDNVKLQQDYRKGFDLEKIEAQAQALGMVPAEQLQTMHIEVAVPEAPAEPSFWETVRMVIAELFANAKV